MHMALQAMKGAMKWPKQITPEYVLEMIRAERDAVKALGIFNSATGEYPNGFRHNQETFGLMIARLACARQFTEAEDLLQRMKQENIQCTEDIFVTVSRAYGRAHLPLEALRTFHRMQDFQCKPTPKSYITIFAVLVQENRLNLAHKFYSHMKKVGIEPSVSSYNILIKAFCKSSETLDSAFRVFREMPQKGCIPDTFTYSTLIDGLCKEGRLIEAGELMKEMERKGCAPNVVTYSTMIHGFCMAAKLDDAMKLLYEMSTREIPPNVVTYSTLMHGLCKAGRSLEAMNLLDKMEAANLLDEMVLNGVTPNALTRNMHESMYNVVIQGLCKEGIMHRAFQIYLSMLMRRDCPNLETFNLLVEGFCKKGDLYKAARIVSEISTNGLVPDNVTWNAIVSGFWSRRKVREAAKLVQDELMNQVL